MAGVQTAPVPAGLDGAAAPRKVALVVGLDRYTPEAGLHDLKYAAADASAVAGRLEHAGYRVATVLDTATRAQFEAALSDATADLQRQDLFVLYFAGHAQLDPAAEGKQLSLLFSDDQGVEGDGLPVEVLAESIEALPVQRRVVLLDTCYSERTQQMLALNRGAPPTVLAPQVGRFDAWIFSAAPQQSAQEDPELGHGVFTWFLLKALDGEADANGDGSVGVLEIYNWVGFKTAERTGRAQVPWIEESRIGWDDLALVEVEARGLQAAIPWYERVLPGSQVFLDGLTRGPGSIEAGRHAVEVRDGGGQLVLKRTVNARGGEVLEWDRLLDASRSTVRIGTGLGFAGSDRVAPLSGAIGGWWMPRAPTAIRPIFGAQGSFGRTRLDPGEVAADLVAGTGRAGMVWMAGPTVAAGPFAGAGGYWSRVPAGLQTTALLEAGGLVQVELGPAWIGLEGGVRSYPYVGQLAAHPAGAALVGASFR